MERRDRSGHEVWRLSRVIHALASSRLALVLVALLILFSLAGAMLPQERVLGAEEIAAWQESHAVLTHLLRPPGLFHVFHSWPFLATIVLLGVNTLTCTLLRFRRDRGFAGLRGPGATRRVGFLLLHLSILGLLAGGFWSAAAGLDGFVLLTEGQSFTESHGGYAKLVEAPLRPERHQGFTARLKKVEIRYEGGRFPVEVGSDLEFFNSPTKIAEGSVRVNRPVTFRGVSFTQDRTGYSPRLEIREARSGRLLVHSFVALQTFGGEGEREYRDYLPLPFFRQRVVLSLYPDHSRRGETVVKTGEEPRNPLLVVETRDSGGEVLERQYLPRGDKITVQGYTLGFADLRRWSALRIAEDPGYPVVLVSLWLGVAALILRYLQDLWRWFGIRSDTNY